MRKCFICDEDRSNDWPPLCNTNHCERCTKVCAICQADLHDGWDAA